jgi:hypothetical protein
VAEAIRRARELDRDERPVARLEELELGLAGRRQRLGGELVADDLRQEVADQDPLVVRRDDPAGLREERRALQPRLLAGDVLDHVVVEADHRVVQLRDDDVLVVARVADDRPALRVALQVAPLQRVAVVVRRGVAALQEPHAPALPVAPLVQVGTGAGSLSVEAVEVEAR